MRIQHAFVVAVVGLFGLGGLAACGGEDDTDAAAGSDASAGSSPPKENLDASKPPVVLTLTAPKVPGADLLTGLKTGAEVAAAKINSQGGIGGRKVEIDACNSQLQPAVATVCAHKAIRKKPVAQFGCELAWSASGLKVFGARKVPSFNCQNSEEDFTNPWSFSINASSLGGRRGTARWLCTRDDVKKVLVMTYDSPDQRATALPQLNPILKGCGKETASVFFPLSGGDLTPYIAKAVDFEPDFIILSTVGTTAVNLFKGFAQNGVEADKIAVPDTALDWDVVDQAGPAIEGAYSQAQFAPWGETDNPDVTSYLETMKQFSKEDPRDPNVQWGYQTVTFFYEAAKKIGVNRFNNETLAAFARTTDDFRIPMSRTMTNPGPKMAPQQKQPYIRIEQYKGDGKFEPIEAGQDGWFFGY